MQRYSPRYATVFMSAGEGRSDDLVLWGWRQCDEEGRAADGESNGLFTTAQAAKADAAARGYDVVMVSERRAVGGSA